MRLPLVAEIGCRGCSYFENPSTGKASIVCARGTNVSKRLGASHLKTTASQSELECDGDPCSEEPLNFDSECALEIAHALRRVKPVCGTESFVATRIRRDCKKAMRGPSVRWECGKLECLFLPLVGKAIRCFGDWYTLCCTCGAVMKYSCLNKFGNDMSCLLCDAQTLGLSAAKPEIQADAAPKCRYCGKRQTKNATWTKIQAPLDESADNADLPSPLRAVFYCNKHYRPWAIDAHRTQKTTVVLSHIGMNVSAVLHFYSQPPKNRALTPVACPQARPQFGADGGAATLLPPPERVVGGGRIVNRNSSASGSQRLRRIRRNASRKLSAQQ
jgi:hypothetical protein